MRDRMRTLLVVVLLALVAEGVFLLVSRADAPAAQKAIPVERDDQPVPSIALDRPDRRTDLPRAGIVVLHLWATWCGPCREELPTLLEAAEGSTLFAVALEETWQTVDAFFDGDVPGAVWRVDETALTSVAPRVLPETLVVADGRVVARARGAQRWTRANFADWVHRATAPTP